MTEKGGEGWRWGGEIPAAGRGYDGGASAGMTDVRARMTDVGGGPTEHSAQLRGLGCAAGLSSFAFFAIRSFFSSRSLRRSSRAIRRSAIF